MALRGVVRWLVCSTGITSPLGSWITGLRITLNTSELVEHPRYVYDDSYMVWGVLYRNQVSRAGTSNYTPLLMWDVITCPCLWYLLLAQQSTFDLRYMHFTETPWNMDMLYNLPLPTHVLGIAYNFTTNVLDAIVTPLDCTFSYKSAYPQNVFTRQTVIYIIYIIMHVCMCVCIYTCIYVYVCVPGFWNDHW